MAKEKKKTGKKFEFSKLNEFLSSEVNSIGSLIGENEFIDTKEFISSGVYALDALLSTRVLKGGIPNNKVIAIGGQSGTGKTFLTLNFAKQAQLQGYYIIYLDSEGAIDNDLVTKFGMDPSMFRIDPIATVESLKIYMAKFIKKMEDMRKDGYELPKVLICLDSMGNLASSKEVNDAETGSEKQDMTRAKQLKSIFRIVTHKLGVLGIPMILTNHTYMSMDMYPREIFSGGSGAVYNASILLMITKAKLKTGDEDELDLGQSGIIVTAKTEKNRLAKPKKVKFEISFNSGANPYKGLENWCTIENFEKVGIAKGKMEMIDEVDEETGEVTGTKPGIKAGGIRWYIRHLDKSIFTKQLFTPKVFTQEVLEALSPIMEEYFKYSSAMEQEEIEEQLEETEKQYDEHSNIEDVDADELFSEDSDE